MDRGSQCGERCPHNTTSQKSPNDEKSRMEIENAFRFCSFASQGNPMPFTAGTGKRSLVENRTPYLTALPETHLPL